LVSYFRAGRSNHALHKNAGNASQIVEKVHVSFDAADPASVSLSFGRSTRSRSAVSAGAKASSSWAQIFQQSLQVLQYTNDVCDIFFLDSNCRSAMFSLRRKTAASSRTGRSASAERTKLSAPVSSDARASAEPVAEGGHRGTASLRSAFGEQVKIWLVNTPGREWVSFGSSFWPQFLQIIELFSKSAA
jgi:hypothetical protein